MVAYSFQRRFIVPIQFGLGLHYRVEDVVDVETASRPKRQTIRAGVIRRNGDAWSKPKGGRRHARAGEALQLYYAQRNPKLCRKIADARCAGIAPVVIWVGMDAVLTIQLRGTLLGPRQMRAFAQSDGFKDSRDMGLFWLAEHGSGKFEGVVIQWVGP